MFGNRRVKLEEQMKAAMCQVNEQRKVFEERVATFENGEKQIFNDVCEMIESTYKLVNHATINIEDESSLMHTIDDFSEELHVAAEEYSQLTALIEDEMSTINQLVDNNKHFTSPSKYLTEVPAVLKQINASYEKKLDVMAEYGRQMGVMALNAAIEAGRMGDSAKQFVSASEEIRQTALVYEKAAIEMKEDVEASYTKIAELEEKIHYLIALLKENNMGTARMFKKCQETNKAKNEASMRDFSENMTVIRDKVLAIRNLEEEIEKRAERHQIQLGDIRDELQNQRTSVVELESDVSYLFDAATEKLYGVR